MYLLLSASFNFYMASAALLKLVSRKQVSLATLVYRFSFCTAASELEFYLYIQKLNLLKTFKNWRLNLFIHSRYQSISLNKMD